MFLYHGTDNLEGIRASNFIDNFKLSDSTQELNEAIENYLEENFRDGAIYLTDSLETANEYEDNIRIPISNLNTNLLYIADNAIADILFDVLYYGTEEDKLNAIKDYRKSFKTYEEFLEDEKNIRALYGKIEFLYFDSININI